MIDYKGIEQGALLERERSLRPSAPKNTSRALHRPIVTVAQIGRPGLTNSEFEGLRADGWSPTRITESLEVPLPIYEQRMEACLACGHATTFADGAVFCECCVCRAWRQDMRKLNRHGANICRRLHPAFRQWPEEIDIGD